MGNTKISWRTNRILILFRLFYYCETVSYNLIKEYFPEVEKEAGRKMVRRYIRLLEEAGLIRLRYSKAERAYVPVDRSFVPQNGQFYPAKLPDSKPKRLYMEKIIRLCTLITEVMLQEEEDPIAWYRKRYPELSDRTRQRDFKQLGEVGYMVEYFPGDIDAPAGYYYDYFDGI
ncbi:MAG: hypothetical protein J1E62_04020 [Lachnospiraceae bacterium]|nr:hypothetical protein [Lachnospiraceae bacterium]